MTERRTPDTCSNCGAPGFRVVSHEGSGSVRFERASGGLDEAVRLLRALVEEVGSEPIYDNRARRMGAWVKARNYLDRLASAETAQEDPR